MDAPTASSRRKERRSRSHTVEIMPVVASGEGLVPGEPPPVVRVQRMSWPGGGGAAGMAAAAQTVDEARGVLKTAAEDISVPAVEERVVDSDPGLADDPLPLSSAADAPWPDLSGCEVTGSHHCYCL